MQMRCTMKYTCPRTATFNVAKQQNHSGDDVEQFEFSAPLMGVENDAATLETCLSLVISLCIREDPATPLLGMQMSICAPKDLPEKVLGNTIHGSPKLDTTYMSINSRGE